MMIMRSFTKILRLILLWQKKNMAITGIFFFFLIGGNFVNIFFAESTSSNLFSSYTHDVCEDLYKDS